MQDRAHSVRRVRALHIFSWCTPNNEADLKIFIPPISAIPLFSSL